MRRRPYGPDAWIVDDLDDPTAWAEALRRTLPAADGVVDIVPAETTVVVCCEPHRGPHVGDRLDDVVVDSAVRTAATSVTIDVVYDGDDLGEVADAVGCTVDEVIALHTAPTYTVAFCGFSPGFAYLTGVDHRLRLPRRDRPRTSVPAGSVAIAAGYSAVYPRESPGGWHLLGHTERQVWDPDRDPPALLVPGITVRFRPLP